MNVLVALTAALWSNLLNVEGNLLEQRETIQEGPRPYFPTPYFPPFSPFNVPPECFPQPVIPEIQVKQECPVCPMVESCTCEPVLNACQTYSITVCPPGAEPSTAVPQKVVEEVVVVDENSRIVDVQPAEVVLTEEEEEKIEEVAQAQSVFNPMGFTPYKGYNQLGMYPQFGGFQGQFGQNLGQFGASPGISGLRSLGDEQEAGDNSNSANNK